MASETIRACAFAKINLVLRILGVRADGYHELRTIFQSLALHDTLVFRHTPGPFRIECDDPRCPTDSTNLIWRAAAAAWKASGRRGAPRDIVIAVSKRIPVAAGLGGGSSDAAASLRALARLWRVDETRLPDIAASIGADVPYFLQGGTVLGLERGDLLYPLMDHPSAWVTLVVPSFGVSSKDAYAWWDERPRRGHAGEFRNDLQAPVAKHHPDISRIVSALRRAGASHAAMSGSGSAVFGLFDRRAAAIRAGSDAGAPSRRVLVTRTLTRADYGILAAK